MTHTAKANNERIGFFGKSVWDWLNLLGVLAIPFVVAVVGLYFIQQITQQQAQLSDAANKQQHQIELQIAEDQQREATLKAYLDDMSDLLLNHNLAKSKPGDAVAQLARERTLTTLRRLDANRNRIVLQFLQDAQLINTLNATGDSVVPIIDLSNVDLSGDDLRGANLSNASLSGAFLSRADLSGAILRNADLSNAHLSTADLLGADLYGADLSKADLSGAHLEGAHLSNANLSGATITQEQLAPTFTLSNATLPDGSKFPSQSYPISNHKEP